MMLIDASSPDLVDQERAVVPGGAAYWTELERRLARDFERAAPRQRGMAYGRGLLSPAARKTSWQLAEVSGDPTPYAFQQLLRPAVWEPDAVREELGTYVVQHLGDPNAVLVLDETGFMKKGAHSAGVARQSSGTAGRLETCQIGVLVAYASRLGHTLLDRELYLPRAWTDHRARCRQAGIPAAREFAPTPRLARQRLARAFASGVPATWGTGASVSGDDRRLRMGLESRPQAYGLAVSGKAYVWLEGQQRQVKRLLAALPEAGWMRRSAGEGAKGPRRYDWRWLPLAAPMAPAWRRWLLVRRRVPEPTALTASVVFAPQEAVLAEVVRVAGTCWTIEQLFEAAKGEVGLDQYEVRSWTGWSRHLTLAMWALALLMVLRAGAIAGETLTNSRPSPQANGRLAVFKASRGLASRCACPKFVGAWGAWSAQCSPRARTSWRGRGGAAGIRASPSIPITNVGERWLSS